VQVQSFACRGDGARVGGFSGARLSWCRTLHVSMAKRRGLVYGFPPSLPGQTQRRTISRVSGVKLLLYRLFILFQRSESRGQRKLAAVKLRAGKALRQSASGGQVLEKESIGISRKAVRIGIIRKAARHSSSQGELK